MESAEESGFLRRAKEMKLVIALPRAKEWACNQLSRLRRRGLDFAEYGPDSTLGQHYQGAMLEPGAGATLTFGG